MASRRIDVHRAVERGDLAVLARYLDAGGDVEKKDTEYGAAPVHWASLRGKVDALSLLLEHGAGLESRTGTDGTPLVWGCMGGDAQVVRYLLEKGADIDAVTKGKGTALHHATNSGHPEVVAILLEKGADPNAQDNRGERPGDRFDREVVDAVRRAITKVLANAKGEGSATKGSSKSKTRDQGRGRASTARTPRSGHDDGTSSSSHGNDSSGGGGGKDSRSNGASHEWASSSGGQRELAGWEQVKPARSDSSVRASAAAALAYGSLLPSSRSSAQSEEDLLSAAEASIAAAAWTPAAATSKLKLTGNKGSSSRNVGSDRKRNGTGADRDTTSSAAAQSNGHSSGTPASAASAAPSSAAAAAAAAAANVPVQPRSSRSTRADPAEGAGFRAPERARAGNGTATVASLQRKLWSPSASATDPELDDLRRQVKDLALTVAVAEKRDIEGKLALRQALAESEKRAEGVGAAAQARSRKMDALVQALERRLCERDDQVKSLKAEVEDRDARLRQAEREVTSLRAKLNGLSGDAATPMASKRVDASPGDFLTPSPLPSRSGSKSFTRTQSSPALSPRISASLRQLASAVDAGGEGGVGIGGGIENSPSLTKRITVGSGSSPADDSFTSPAGVAGTGPGTGTGNSKAGVLGWWKRNDYREDVQAANKEKPRPITEDQERLGNLYSMIARR
ncbi:unnamed protein product [Laminaria digitata]